MIVGWPSKLKKIQKFRKWPILSKSGWMHSWGNGHPDQVDPCCFYISNSEIVGMDGPLRPSSNLLWPKKCGPASDRKWPLAPLARNGLKIACGSHGNALFLWTFGDLSMCSSSSKDMIAPKSCFSFHKSLFLNFFPSSYTVTDSDRWPVGMDNM